MNMKLPAPFIAIRRLSRRHFLKGVGVAMSLPLLDVMQPSFARAASTSVASPASHAGCSASATTWACGPTCSSRPTRVANTRRRPISNCSETHRNDFTVISGVSHPNVDGGHPSDISFLTAAPHPASSSFRNTISLDQYIAERIGTLTRFPSLTLAVNGAARSLSWTGTGVAIPPEERASEVFNQLFLQGTPEQVEAQIHRLDTGRSILDAVAEQAKDLERNVGARDRSRLDQYFTSVRDLEHRLQESRDWESKPKPVVKFAAPAELASPAQYMDKVKAMYDLARLAFETDSTRAITLMLNSVGTPVVTIPGETITDSYHNLSHHGKTEEKLAQLKVLDEWHMKLLANLFTDLAGGE